MKSLALLCAAMLLLSGCTRRYVDISVRNDSGGPVNTVEVDYPGGSFGKAQIAAGQEFHYHFKSLHDGALKLSFSDAAGHIVASDGPAWKENHSGQVEVVIVPGGAVKWNSQHSD